MNIEKIIKKLPTGFVDEIGSLGKQALRDMIIQCESNIRAVENERDNDEKLQGAKELVKDFSGPYREAVQAQRAKIAYILHTLEERGELPASE